MVEIPRTADGQVARSAEQGSAQALSQYVGGLFSRTAPPLRTAGRELDFAGVDEGSATRPLAEKPHKSFEALLPINNDKTSATTKLDAKGNPVHTLNLVLDKPVVIHRQDGSKLYFAQEGSGQFSQTESASTHEIKLTKIKGLEGTLPEADKNEGAAGNFLNKVLNKVAGKAEIESARFVREKGQPGKPETDKYSLVVTAVVADNRFTGRQTEDFPQELTAAEFKELHTRIAGYLGDKVASR